MVRRLLLAAALGSLAAPGPVALGADTAATVTAAVTIDNFTFTPAVLTVPVGAAVTWTNHDDIPHTVVLPSPASKSPVLDTDEHFNVTFAKAGTYTYFCGLHPHMQGTLVVK